MKAKFWIVVSALLVAGAVGVAHGKLPSPPPVDPEKAAAAKAKAAEAAKKEADLLAKAQDRAAAHYKKEKGMTATVASKKK